jgi:hypothetical protein
VRVAASVDVGIDADGDPGAAAGGGGEGGEPVDFPADSMLIAPTPIDTARPSSSWVLPTPVMTMSAGAKPARRATSISPAEFASAPAPSARRREAMASVELALSA